MFVLLAYCIIALITFPIRYQGKTRIPWFSYAPFHAGLGIMTGRLLLHLRKTVWIAEMGSSDTSSETEMDETTTSWGVPGHSPRVVSDDSVFDTSFSDSR